MAQRYVIVALFGAVLLTGAWWVLSARSSLPTETATVASPVRNLISNGASSTSSDGVTITSDPFFGQSPVRNGLREYQSLIFRFTMWIPQELQLKEYSETNTTTLVFNDPATNYGFQIFVVPYAGTTVSVERFKMDEPSGVMQNPTPITIDGTPATMFYGQNTIGETREVWFIKNGFLYEVTTYKQLDAWLANIMQTWKFI